jgi:Fe-S oxidoreductase
MLDKLKKYSWISDAIANVPFKVKTAAIGKLMASEKPYPKAKRNAEMDDIVKCSLCPNMCRYECPTTRGDPRETVSPSGKTRTAYYLEAGRIEWTPEAIKPIYECNDCGGCKQQCAFDYLVLDLLVGVRQDINEKGLTPEAVKNMVATLDKTRRTKDIAHKYAGIGEKSAEVLYFLGCTPEQSRPEILDANIAIFNKAGVKFQTLKEEWCCGGPLQILGFPEKFKEFAEHNARAFKESGAKTIVCNCPKCTYMLRVYYPEHSIKINAEILHTTEFLARLIKNKKLKLKPVAKKVTYHDPCFLTRKLEVMDEPRAVLGAIPQLQLLEADYRRKDSRCCGAGGSMRTTVPDVAAKIAKTRIAELKEKSNVIVSACSSCEISLKEADPSVEVKDVSELVREALE